MSPLEFHKQLQVVIYMLFVIIYTDFTPKYFLPRLLFHIKTPIKLLIKPNTQFPSSVHNYLKKIKCRKEDLFILLFEQKFEQWIQANLLEEKNHRRRELLEKGLGHGTIEFLRKIWFPTVGNFDDLYPEWEVRDFNNRYRYLDLAYMPGGMQGGIEIQGYGPHARDIDVSRFKDLCWRHSLLALDGWTLLPIAYLSIKEEPNKCKQLILAFIGKFISLDAPARLSWSEAETLRFARRELRPITPIQIAEHLRVSVHYARKILRKLVDLQFMQVTNGKKRYRSFEIR